MHSDLKELVMPLGDLIRKQAARYGSKMLFECHGVRRSYAEFDERTTRLAGGLQTLGVRPGDKVACYMPNAIELLEAYYATSKAGAVTVFLNAMLTAREIRFVLQDSESKVIFTAPGLLPNVQEVRPDAGHLETIVVQGGTPPPDTVRFDDVLEGGPYRDVPVKTEDVAWLGYTSGTTGRPKGAILTHLGATHVGATVADRFGYREDDIVLCALPLFHSYAVNSCMIQVMMAGAGQVILERFTPDGVLQAIQDHRITVFPGVPTMFNYLVNFPDRAKYDLISLRIAKSAGAVLPAKLMHDFETLYGVPLVDGYGITEAHSFVTLNDPRGKRPDGSCGKAIEGVDVRIVDGQDRDVPAGERGELIFRGPNLPLGYVNGPEATAEALRGGWYHSGDVAYMDAEGYVYIVDRIKDTIICGGYNIYPKEVEDVIYAHPAVLDVAVVGVADEAKGEIPKACVVLKPEATVTAGDLEAYCRQNLAAYKVPRVIEFMDAIPKTASGKTKRFLLRQRA
ncbi:MAG: long-chain fatty acid--CoA ligase [Candidatus Rokubacteria bacterium]|nr:long-chain fatty acid--CoA ligase [Candidatus Rokubacteria bacterium]